MCPSRIVHALCFIVTIAGYGFLFQLLEFQEAVEHREGIISQLSGSLQQAIQSRDALQLQGDQLAQEVALLQRQLQATTTLIQGHHWDTGIKPHDYLTLQNQVIINHLILNKIFIWGCIVLILVACHISCLSVTNICMNVAVAVSSGLISRIVDICT
jgi:hypothetical protein